ncbi:MAG TPA: hypothetical protein H9835_05815 [Candidatus Agathobaculum merdigallinarum]|nr:hypothetical protein [Candidatus Agathobaculum merdigallinarum]
MNIAARRNVLFHTRFARFKSESDFVCRAAARKYRVLALAERCSAKPPRLKPWFQTKYGKGAACAAIVRAGYNLKTTLFSNYYT